MTPLVQRSPWRDGARDAEELPAVPTLNLEDDVLPSTWRMPSPWRMMFYPRLWRMPSPWRMMCYKCSRLGERRLFKCSRPRGLGRFNCVFAVDDVRLPSPASPGWTLEWVF